MAHERERPLLIFGLEAEHRQQIIDAVQQLGGIAMWSPQPMTPPVEAQPIAWDTTITGVSEGTLLTQQDVTDYASARQFGIDTADDMWDRLATHGVVDRHPDRNERVLSTNRLHVYIEETVRTEVRQRPNPRLGEIDMRLALRLNDDTLPSAYTQPKIPPLFTMNLPDQKEPVTLVTEHALSAYRGRLKVRGGEPALRSLFLTTPDLDDAWPNSELPSYRRHRLPVDTSPKRLEFYAREYGNFEAAHVFQKRGDILFGRHPHVSEYNLVGRTPQQFFTFLDLLLEHPDELRSYEGTVGKPEAAAAAEYTLRRYARALRQILEPTIQ